MIKGSETFEEVQACVKIVGDELSSGWSQSAIKMAIMAVLTNWMAVRCLNGSSLEQETAKLSSYLEVSVWRVLSEIGQAMGGGH
jgi:hypothetical protein